MMDRVFQGNLKQIFFYITSRCNLNCRHCYIQPKTGPDMTVKDFKRLLKKLMSLGADKLTLLGGEPTLHPQLPEFLAIAKTLGIHYLRLDTNGQFNESFFQKETLQHIDNICFSLEGPDPETHESIRTRQNYDAVMHNMQKAIDSLCDVRVTMTVTSTNICRIEEMIHKLGRIGVSSFNLHLITPNGRANNHPSLLVEEKKWMAVYKELRDKAGTHNGLKTKIPIRYIKKTALPGKKLGCECYKKTRISVTSDLKLYSCPLLIEEDRYFAYYNGTDFVYPLDFQKNTFAEADTTSPYCPVLSEENGSYYKTEGIHPVCISQKEII